MIHRLSGGNRSFLRAVRKTHVTGRCQGAGLLRLQIQQGDRLCSLYDKPAAKDLVEGLLSHACFKRGLGTVTVKIETNPFMAALESAEMLFVKRCWKAAEREGSVSYSSS